MLQIEIISFCFNWRTFSRRVTSGGDVGWQKMRLGPIRARKLLISVCCLHCMLAANMFRVDKEISQNIFLTTT